MRPPLPTCLSHLATVLLLALTIIPAQAHAQQSVATAMQALRDSVDCDTPSDEAKYSVAERVVCDGTFRVGLRTDYPPFSYTNGKGFDGFEADLARDIARRLGVTASFIEVTPVTRITRLGEGEIDLAIATMGHNTQRDPTVTFLRPHYFQSETVLVGAVDTPPLEWEALEGRLVCTTVGNYSNFILAPAVARLMLFPGPEQLISALENEVCSLIAQDDTLLLPLIEPDGIPARFERKLGFAPVPWGMALPLGVEPEMTSVMSALLREMHRDGTFLRLAKENNIPTLFLTEERARWQSALCQGEATQCLAPPLEVVLEASSVSGLANKIEALLLDHFGIELRLGFMETQVAWGMFLGGLGVSVLAVFLVLFATAGFSVLFAAMLLSRFLPVRIVARLSLAVFQNTPVILILLVMSTLTIWTFSYSFGSALLAAILAIAGSNGSFAGAAIAEAYNIGNPSPPESRFIRAIGVATAQVDNYLTNAVRGISAASIVGVPDLLNALNDITAFSGSQGFHYSILIFFYIAGALIAAQVTRKALPFLISRWQV